jgi:hypothetical protein
VSARQSAVMDRAVRPTRTRRGRRRCATLLVSRPRCLESSPEQALLCRIRRRSHRTPECATVSARMTSLGSDRNGEICRSRGTRTAGARIANCL